MKTISLMKPVQTIKLKVMMMVFHAILKLNAEIAFQIKDAGLKKMPKFTELTNSEKFQVNLT